jgi:hypothetical protein
MAQTQVSGPSTVKSSTTGKTFSVPGGSFISSDYSVVGGGNTGTNAGANSSAAGGFNNPYPINPSAMFGGITGDLRAANEKRHRSLESQEVGEIQGERAFEQKSQDFARARLGKIGGFSGTYGIGLQNSIANRTESNIREIKRATQEAKDSGDFELEGRLAELGLQQMTLMTQLNDQAFQQYKFGANQDYQRDRDTELDRQYNEGFLEDKRQFGLNFDEDVRQFNVAEANATARAAAARANGDKDDEAFWSDAEGFIEAIKSGEDFVGIEAAFSGKYPDKTQEEINTALRGGITQREVPVPAGFEGPSNRVEERTGLANPDNILQEPSDRLTGLDASDETIQSLIFDVKNNDTLDILYQKYPDLTPGTINGFYDKRIELQLGLEE